MINSKEKGISLVALVITIIVLVILAATVIIVFNHDGILSKANYAKNENNKQEVYSAVQRVVLDVQLSNPTLPVNSDFASILEEKLLESYSDSKATANYNINTTNIDITLYLNDKEEYKLYLDSKYILNWWTDPLGGYTIGQKIEGFNLKGTYIYDLDDQYNREEVEEKTGVAGVNTFVYNKDNNNMEWRVLGTDGKNVLLLGSSSSVQIKLSGKNGLINGPDTLNEICKKVYSIRTSNDVTDDSNILYEARSINEDDIFNLLGIRPTKARYSNFTGGFNSSTKCSDIDTPISDIKSYWGNLKESDYITPDNKELDRELLHNYSFIYSTNENNETVLVDLADNAEVCIVDDKIYDIIYQNVVYALASPYICFYMPQVDRNIWYSIPYVNYGNICTDGYNIRMSPEVTTYNDKWFYVRPVLSIPADKISDYIVK